MLSYVAKNKTCQKHNFLEGGKRVHFAKGNLKSVARIFIQAVVL